MLAAAAVVSHRIDSVSVKVRATQFPARALPVRAQKEGSLGGPHQQKKVSLLNVNVLNAVQHGGSGLAHLGRGSGGHVDRRLHRFESSLDFAGALVSMQGFLRQAALNDGPESGRDGRSKRLGHLTHDSGADFKSSASVKGETSGSGFIQQNAECPQIAAVISPFAAQDFGSDVWESAAYSGSVEHGVERAGYSIENRAADFLG